MLCVPSDRYEPRSSMWRGVRDAGAASSWYVCVCALRVIGGTHAGKATTELQSLNARIVQFIEAGRHVRLKEFVADYVKGTRGDFGELNCVRAGGVHCRPGGCSWKRSGLPE